MEEKKEKITIEELKKRLEEAQTLKKKEKDSSDSSLSPSPSLPPPLSSDELKIELERCQKEREEFLVGWKRERADFLNYKKEEDNKINELVKYSNEGLILKILPVLDNIYIAEEKLPEALKLDQWVEGILKIKTQILDFLKSQEVEEIKCLGKKFDPNFHEAVKESKKPGFEPGTIIWVIKKGYLFHGKTIRPAKVEISK